MGHSNREKWPPNSYDWLNPHFIECFAVNFQPNEGPSWGLWLGLRWIVCVGYFFLNRQGSERSSDFWNWCILSPDFVAIQFVPTAVQKPAPHRPLSSHAFRIPRSPCPPRPDLLWVRRPYQCPAQPLGWFQLICSCVDLWFFSSGVSSLWTIARRGKIAVEFCSRFLNFNGLLYYYLLYYIMIIIILLLLYYIIYY